MKKRFRFTLLVGAALALSVAAVASAGQAHQDLRVEKAGVGGPSAVSAFTSAPELAVQQGSYKLGAATSPGFLLFSAATNPAPAKITIFSPSGYTSALTQAPGTTVGKAYAIVAAGTLGGAPLPLSGPVVVGNPADPALQQASLQCRGTTTNQEILVLDTSLQGTSIQVPDFVNTVGPYVTQEICLPPPATAALQAQLVIANFTVNGMWTNGAAAGPYQWVGDFTPYNGAAPDAASTVELRTFVGLPSSLTFKRLKSKSSIVKFAGKLSISGVSPATLRMAVNYATAAKPSEDFRNPSAAGLLGKGKQVHAKGAKANGSWSITRPKVKKKTYFQARLRDEWKFQDGCQGPSPTGQPIPCLEELLSPMNSNQILVKPPKKKRHHH
jgi:hypothetical protein